MSTQRQADDLHALVLAEPAVLEELDRFGLVGCRPAHEQRLPGRPRHVGDRGEQGTAGTAASAQ